MIRSSLIKDFTKNPVNQWECDRSNDDKNARSCDEELDDRFETQHALARCACASDNGENEDCRIDRKWYSGLSYNVYNKASDDRRTVLMSATVCQLTIDKN